jgi:hypothetical protein
MKILKILTTTCFLFSAYASNALELNDLIGNWKLEKCAPENSLSSNLLITPIEDSNDIRVDYVNDKGEITKNFSTRIERFSKINKSMNNTEISTSTESAILGDRLYIAAIHQHASTPLFLGANLSNMALLQDGRLEYSRTGQTATSEGIQYGSITCHFKKQL